MKFRRTASLLCLLTLLRQASAELHLEVSPAARIALGITVESIRDADYIDAATASGVVVAPPGQSYPVSSPFPGIVLEPLVVPGIRVDAGERVVLLHSPDYATAQSELETLRLDAEHDEHVAERTRELRKLGLRSEQEAEEAEHLAKVASLALNAMRMKMASVEPAQGAGRHYLTASVGGVVTHITANAGESVQPSTPILTIFQGNRFWAQVQFPERLVHLVELGAEVQVIRSGQPGQVIAIDPEVDPTTRSSEILVSLPESDEWRLGQIIDMTFESSLEAGAIIVPTRAVIRVAGQQSVFVETGSGFRVVNVTALTRSMDSVVITGPLSPVDRVAVTGLAALKNMSDGA